MDDKQIQDIADRVIAALENLAPVDPGFRLADLGPIAVFTAALVAAWVGWRNLLHQQKALAKSGEDAESALTQKREADARSEWWRRTQWALEATISDSEQMNNYGVKMLEILVKSDMAGPGDKEMLDTVWQGTEVEEDEEIEQFLEDFQDMDKDELDPEDAEALDNSRIAWEAIRREWADLHTGGSGSPILGKRVDGFIIPGTEADENLFVSRDVDTSRIPPDESSVDDPDKSGDNEAKKEGDNND